MASAVEELSVRQHLTGRVDDPQSWMRWLEDAFAAAPTRFAHSRAVWSRAAELRARGHAWLSPSDADTLEIAALLHDVGRAVDPGNSEPHGFVGARLLDAVGLHRAAPLVAHHSASREEAGARGLAHLDVWVDADPDLLSVLTYLDRTTSSDGHEVSVATRRAEIVMRYGSDSIQVAILATTVPQLRRAAHLLDLPDPGDVDG